MAKSTFYESIIFGRNIDYDTDTTGQTRPFRDLRRALRGRDPDARPPGAGGGLSRGQEGRRLQKGVRLLSSRIRGAGDAAVRGAEAHRGPRRREDLPQAGGHEPHRLAQDQQHPRAVPPRPADGEEEGDRRDRGGTARRGDGHRGGALRHGVPDLHGRRGYPAAGPQRPSDADPRGRRRPDRRRERQPSRTR